MAIRWWQKYVHAWAVVLGLGAVCAIGCRTADVTGDSPAVYGEKTPPKTSKSEDLLGLSKEANDIERDLGTDRHRWRNNSN